MFIASPPRGNPLYENSSAETLRGCRESLVTLPAFAQDIDDYVVCMDEELTVDFKHLERLLSQVAPDTPGGARQVAAEWIMPGVSRASVWPKPTFATTPRESFLLYLDAGSGYE